MRRSCLAWAFPALAGTSLFLCTGVGAQPVGGTPPADGRLAPLPPALPPQPPVVRVNPDGSIFERDAGTKPIMGLPITGIGLPPGDPGIDGKPVGRPQRPIFPPDYPPDTRWDGPSSEEEPFQTRSQPLFQDFAGLGPNGLTPPDPDLAVGFDYIVEVTNDDFTVYDRCGTVLFTTDIHDFLGVSTNYLVFDPKVIFDPWNSRWVIMYHKKREATEEATMAVIISSGSAPPGIGGWWWYDYGMVQNGGTADASWNDYYDLGYSNENVYFSGNQFRFAGGFRWGRIDILNKTEIYAAATSFRAIWSNLNNPDGSSMTTPRAVKMQASWSEGGQNVDAIFMNSREGGGSRLTVRKVRDAFATNVLTAADVNVTAYVAPPSAQQPSGDTLDTINCRLMTAVATTDTFGTAGIEIFTGLTTAFNAATAAHLFKLDGPSNALEWETRFFSTDNYYWYPSVAADYSGSAMWTYSYSSNVNNIFASARFVDYNKGVWSNSSNAIMVGTGEYGAFRWGDYLGGQIDWGDYAANFSLPGRPAKMWLVGEYGTPGNWGTRIGGSSVFSQGDLSSVSPAGLVVFSGPKGGPFAPASQNYTLGHTGDTGVQVQVTSLPTWLTHNLNETNADMYTGGKTVNIAVTAAANSLGMGTYDDTITFSDCFNGGFSYNRSVRLIAQAPDLAVVSLDAANGVYNPGQIINVQGQYRNDGNIATGPYTANFYLSTNTTISTGDELIDSRNYASLAAGSTLNFSHNLSAIPCVPEGLYYVGVIVTVTNENSPANNVGHDPVQIRVEYCPADYNNDCFVDGIDSDQFNNDFEAGSLAADFNGDGFVDGIDYDQFFNAFETPCP